VAVKVRFCRLLFFVRAVTWATLLTVAVFVASPAQAQKSTAEHLEEPGWWPRKASQSAEEYAGTRACRSCHKETTAEQENTPMARTLLRAEDSGVLRSHRQLKFQSGNFLYRMGIKGGKPELSVTDGRDTITALLQWAFGTGEVGQSYLFQRKGIYFESRVSYFGSLENLSVTPLKVFRPLYDLEDAMARPVQMDEIKRCFSCHGTGSAIGARFEPDKIATGIGCEACHGPGGEHVNVMQASVIQEGAGGEHTPAVIFNPGKLRPADSVDFCGACHGTWPDTVRAGLNGLFSIRQQPYRLQNSKCWGKSQGDARITCVACHDPHGALVQEPSFYDAKCLNCHVATPGVKPAGDHPGAWCPVGMRDCVSCHMPKIEIPVMHRAFADHQIRIVRPGQPLPN